MMRYFPFYGNLFNSSKFPFFVLKVFKTFYFIYNMSPFKVFDAIYLYLIFSPFFLVKSLYLELASWPQFRGPNCVGNIQSIIISSQANLGFPLSIRPNQGIDLFHFYVLEFLYSLLDLVFVGLAAGRNAVYCCFLSSSWQGQWSVVMVLA